MLSDAESGLADLSPEHSWHPWALLVNGCAHVLLGDDGPAGAILTEAANASERLGRTESHALALCERSLLAPANDDEKAESLALQARYLIEDAELDAYATSALEIAISARTLLRHGQWDDARRQLTVAQRLAPSLTHAIPWLSLQVRLELIRAYVTLRDRDGAHGPNPVIGNDRLAVVRAVSGTPAGLRRPRPTAPAPPSPRRRS